MNPTSSLTARTKNPIVPSLLSLVIPGAGQIYLSQYTRGGIISVMTVVLGYVIKWSAEGPSKVGEMELGGVTTTWVWILLAAFWAWNVYDAYQLSRGEAARTWIGLLIAAIIIYFVGWQVTDVHLERFVTRFSAAQRVMSEIFCPDVIQVDAAIRGTDKRCTLVYLFENPGAVKPSENFGDIFGRVVYKPAPAWLVRLGVAKETIVPMYDAGSLIVTIAMGLMATLLSTVLAVPLSFFAARNITARIPGGILVYYLMRTLLNVVRSVDTFIWGIIVVIWVGLGSFAGVMAMTIHSIAALGKLFSEEIEHIDVGPIEAVTASGANLFQVIRYAVFPQIIPPFLAYTLLRWDINMRSATIVGMVAGGGIGYFVVESLRKGATDQYAAALWAIAIVIIAVDYISAYWRERILVGNVSGVAATVPQPFYKSWRAWVYMVLGTVALIYVWNISQIKLEELFNPDTNFGSVVLEFVSIDLKPELVEKVLGEMIVTIFQALLATTLGSLIAIPFSFLAARNLTGRSVVLAWIYYATRFLFNFLRSIEALLYVTIFVFWVGIGNFAGMLALAVTTFGLIGKLFSEAIENIDEGTMEATTATGANRLQVIVYSVLPQIVPPFISYSIYQWDINVRIATIVGFAGGGGIGRLFIEYFGLLQYHKAGTAVAVIILVVAILDFASAQLRRRMV